MASKVDSQGFAVKAIGCVSNWLAIAVLLRVLMGLLADCHVRQVEREREVYLYNCIHLKL